ncbi:MAG: hypothetical protein KAS32_30630, partial [Candidatus Peribacteraceae bacterium]|nr:hypothetical protein [Candidatus Peribacteraceae bacterium]
EVQNAPFIAEKRLFILEGLPRGKKEDIEKLVKCLHEDVLILVLLETDSSFKGKKLSSVASALLEVASEKKFPNISRSQIISWIGEMVKECGAEGIEANAISFLFDAVGENQEALESELNKISLYAYDRTITQSDISLLLTSGAEREVWKIMDYLGNNNPEQAIKYAESLLDRGYSPQALWSTLLWMVSILTQIVSYIEVGQTDSWQIAKSVRAHSSSIKSILPYAKSINNERLKRIVDMVITADIGLKTGEYRATSDSQEELLALIDRSIMAFVE